MSVAEWSLFVGALLVTMVLAGTLLGRLPLSSAMVYLALGWLLGPSVANVLGSGLARWWSIDLVWATAGGILIGGMLGAATGRLVVYLRSRHGEAEGLDEFLGLGLVGMSYGIAQLSLAFRIPRRLCGRPGIAARARSAAPACLEAG